MTTAVTTRLTPEQFEKQFADAPSCELVRGEVVTLSPGAWRHSEISSNAAILIGNWARQSHSGRALTNEVGLVTARDPDTVRGADVAYFSYARLPKGKEPRGFSSIPPELVIEVVGKGQSWQAMVEKAGEYLRMGVDRVWVIDPEAGSLHIFRADAEPRRLDQEAALADEAVLPGFSCRVAEFFES